MKLDYADQTTGKVFGINMPAPIVERLNDKLAERAANELMHKTFLEASHEQGRALLAYTALENTMMLSALETICNRTAPLGDLRYSQIINAYAAAAAKRIERW